MGRLDFRGDVKDNGRSVRLEAEEQHNILTLVPALDNFAHTNHRFEWLATNAKASAIDTDKVNQRCSPIATRIEFLAVYESPNIMNLDLVYRDA